MNKQPPVLRTEITTKQSKALDRAIAADLAAPSRDSENTTVAFINIVSKDYLPEKPC